MELLITKNNKNSNNNFNDNFNKNFDKKTYYDYLCDFFEDKKFSDLTLDEKEKEIKLIINMLMLNYEKDINEDKIIFFIKLMEDDGYTLKQIKDCFESIIRYHPYPNFSYATLTNPTYNRKLYTRQEIIASGRSLSEFIYFETPDKRRFYWDTKYGALPKMFKEIKSNNPVVVYIIDPENPKHLATWDIANNPNCPYNYITAEELCELTPKELNEKLGCKFYDETPNEIAEKFLKKFVKHF
ncbi:MAG TPA: hypothetical protein PLU67_03350 [Candidatus Kapabacteria bacterium]|nr:hypothetical protein [Candidatus Kapabacteria bacterium]